LAKWVTANGVLNIVLGDDTHPEILKRCAPILKFLCRREALPQ
jgi:hypothetical protein